MSVANIAEKRIELLNKIKEKIPDYLNLETELLIKELKKLGLEEEEITNVLALISLLKIEILTDILVFDKLVIGLSPKPYINFNFPQLPKPAEICLFFYLKNLLRPDLVISDEVKYYASFCLIIHGLLVLPDMLKELEPYLETICKMKKEDLEDLKRRVKEKFEKIKDLPKDKLFFEENIVDVQLARLMAIHHYEG